MPMVYTALFPNQERILPMWPATTTATTLQLPKPAPIPIPLPFQPTAPTLRQVTPAQPQVLKTPTGVTSPQPATPAAPPPPTASIRRQKMPIPAMGYLLILP